MKSRLLLAGGLTLLLIAGVLVSFWSSDRTAATVETQLITTNGRTITITKVEKQNVPGPGIVRTITLDNGQVTTVTVPRSVTVTRNLPGAVRVVSAPARTATTTRVVTGPGRTITQTQTVSVTRVQTVTAPGGVQTVVQNVPVPGPTVTVVETVTVKGNGNCPPQNPHCP